MHRVGDSDARCGAASIQKFEGEDLSIASRVLGQNQQCKAWWQAELARKKAEKDANDSYNQALASRVSPNMKRQAMQLRKVKFQYIQHSG